MITSAAVFIPNKPNPALIGHAEMRVSLFGGFTIVTLTYTLRGEAMREQVKVRPAWRPWGVVWKKFHCSGVIDGPRIPLPYGLACASHDEAVNRVKEYLWDFIGGFDRHNTIPIPGRPIANPAKTPAEPTP